MSSTFHGLEVAKRGMFTQQSALYTTAQNISNANTEGYSRQRVDFVTTEPYPPASRNRPQIPGQMGTGVEAGDITRIRETFLDQQYRGENTKRGYWEMRSDALSKLEEIMNEPSDQGLAVTMDQFWQSLEDLAANPENSGSRSTVRQRAIAVTDTFNFLSDSLVANRNDFRNEMDITVKEANNLLDQINQLNKQISEVEPHGYLPNDLYDKRDLLVDRLSGIINIKVSTVPSAPPSNTQMSALAVGKYKIEIMDETGVNSFGTLLDGDTIVNQLSFNQNYDTDSQGPIGLESISSGTVSYIPSSFRGKLQGLTDAYTDIFPGMQKNLDEMAFNFVKEFNKVHNGARSTPATTTYGLVIDPDTPAATPYKNTDFFEDLTTSTNASKKIAITNEIRSNTNYIAASKSGLPGDNANALDLADVRYNSMNINGQSTTIESFYASLIGEMGVEAQAANTMLETTTTLRQAVEDRRQSVSGVSLDEEMTNMIKFQQAYNASARMITIVDEMLDKIINGMGVGGR